MTEQAQAWGLELDIGGTVSGTGGRAGADKRLYVIEK